MNKLTPTIHDLNRKSIRELHVMFRHAAMVAASERYPASERQAAGRTLDHIRRSFAAKVPRP
ncbi:TPA: hypothetical protein N2C61_006457 [Pseudomonas aeruginosa]|uniref:hypothetical protein n=1 Tax=Alcaligenes xylosoxydans xylosoxydans TaxID=85698 RepID=UPI00033220FF|nr:hypothetical protein [Achromobacter xylosoxidans]CCH05722.1 hypothetical protein NH44784_017501 [Achromobacter xylosoxidans NH44784-1996]HCL4135292.1 hypothetical protein [Pseudomonas aeruginosa]